MLRNDFSTTLITRIFFLAVTAVLHFSYEKRGEEPVIAVANCKY
jgi:hypothetical protein